jgi:AraC-like DNA-binding protein
MYDELFNITSTISFFLLILFSVFLLDNSRKNRPGNYYLASFLLCHVIILGSMLVWGFKLAWSVCYLAQIYLPFLFLYAPMLFLYTKSLVQPAQKPKYVILHFLPFMVSLSFLLSKFLLFPWNEKDSILNDNILLSPFSDTHLKIFLWSQFLFYAPQCIRLLFIYRKASVHDAAANIRIGYAWLSFLVVAFLVWKTIFLTGYLWFAYAGSRYYGLFKAFIEFGFLAYSSILVYKALSSPSLFIQGIIGNKYKYSPLSNTKIEMHLKTLEDYMRNKKPYLSSDFSLKEMAAETSIRQHHISQILNIHLNLNFYDFVNRYRIEESVKLLSSTKYDDKNIIEIIYETGFNSKSVFNTAFKKHMGITPSEFKKWRKKLHKNVSLN